MKSSLNSQVCLTYSKIFTGNFYDIAYSYKLITPQCLGYDNSSFLS